MSPMDGPLPTGLSILRSVRGCNIPETRVCHGVPPIGGRALPDARERPRSGRRVAARGVAVRPHHRLRAGRRLHPRAGQGGPIHVRAEPGDPRWRGLHRRRPRALHDPVGLQAVRLRPGAGRQRRRNGAVQDRGRAHRRPVQHDQPRRRERPGVQPDGERRGDRDRDARGRADPRGAVRPDPRRAVRVRGPRAGRRRGRLRLRARHRRPQPRHRVPDALRRAARPRRRTTRWRCTSASARSW